MTKCRYQSSKRILLTHLFLLCTTTFVEFAPYTNFVFILFHTKIAFYENFRLAPAKLKPSFDNNFPFKLTKKNIGWKWREIDIFVSIHLSRKLLITDVTKRHQHTWAYLFYYSIDILPLFSNSELPVQIPTGREEDVECLYG